MTLRLAVALDLSQDDPEHLLRRAVAYAQAARAPLDLVYVGQGDAPQRQLDALLRDQVPPALQGQARLLDGEVVDTLVALSGHLDVLIVGPRNPRGLERWLHGPIAMRVLKRAQCPILIPKTDRFGTRPPRVLMGIDVRSDRRDRTLALAGSLAAELGATIDLVHTLPGSLPPIRRPDMREAVMAAWAKAHRDRLEAVTALLTQLPEPCRGEARLSPGEPEDVLVQSSPSYDLVIVGNRNRTGFVGGFVLGPVSSSVIPRADSDILVLPTASLAPPAP